MTRRPAAHFAGQLATDLLETVDLLERPEALGSGWWAVVAEFEGKITGYRFGRVDRRPLPEPAGHWLRPVTWTDSMAESAYQAGVSTIREYVAAGTVYQVNLCRMLSADLARSADPVALAHLLAAGNPARYQGFLDTGTDWIVTATPELFLRRSGDLVTSAPVKGTAAPGQPFADKDIPENVMIADLVRNDLGRVCRPGSVRVTGLLETVDLPGLRHLVSTVTGRLAAGVGWAELLAAALPPGSVSGAPKHTALQLIRLLEPVPRGPYCGAIGYVDGDRGEAELGVGIRTFHTTSGGARVHFGTGAGITHDSDPVAEWVETRLKAARLIALAGGGAAGA